MSNQSQCVRPTTAVLMTLALIGSLLPSSAAAQDLSTRGASAEEAAPSSQIHHREHNLLLDATLSGHMNSFNKGLRRFDGGECQPSFLVYDFKKQSFLDFSRWIRHKHKRMVVKTDVYAYGVNRNATLGVVPENKAAYWMAEWEAPVSVNFMTLTGSYPDEPSQANTAWKIELRSNGQWRVHAQGVGGWYDPTALAAIISLHANKHWFSNVEGVTVGNRYEDYRFSSTTAPTSVRIIRDIDADAIRNDIFEILNGRPTKLRESASAPGGGFGGRVGVRQGAAEVAAGHRYRRGH